jgi:hypothetical protein
VKACEQFVEGNVLEAMVIVYKRNQERISKAKDFERAMYIFKDVTGHLPENF